MGSLYFCGKLEGASVHTKPRAKRKTQFACITKFATALLYLFPKRAKSLWKEISLVRKQIDGMFSY